MAKFRSEKPVRQISPIVSVPTEPVDTPVGDDAKFQVSAEPARVFASLLYKHGVDRPENFVDNFDKTKLSPEEKTEIIEATKADIEWVKEKLAFKLRKPMWQTPTGKEKLLRMFNKYVGKRLRVLESLGEKV